jgi:6-phosphogluconolactonase
MNIRLSRRARNALALILLGFCVMGVTADGSGSTIQKSSVSKNFRSGKALLYAAVGSELRQYELDISRATLSERNRVTLPENIQAAWGRPSGRYVYVAWSNGTANTPGTKNGLSVLRVDSVSGAMLANGEPAALPSRPIYVSTDIPGRHVLVAYTIPAGITVHAIAADGTIGEPIEPRMPLEFGIYGHEVLVDPSNTMVILVARGYVATSTQPEKPGALNVFSYKDGFLANVQAIAPGGGFNFHPRYMDFHPSKPWIFVSLSQQNSLAVYEKLKDGTLKGSPQFVRNTLANPAHVEEGQLTGALHIHPTGRFVYVVNRAGTSVKVEGKAVFAGGENSIAVFEINQKTGEPTLVQNIDTRGITPNEFALDPTGKILVVANPVQLSVRDKGVIKSVLPNLAIFRVGSDGRLDYVRKYEIDMGRATFLPWMGITALP